MANSADPDQLEANWVWPTLFGKAWYIRDQQVQDYTTFFALNLALKTNINRSLDDIFILA